MKHAFVCIAVLMLSLSLLAQTPAPSQPAPEAHSGPHHDMGAMHQQHLQDMKDQVAKMRATLEKMKATVAAEKGSKENSLEQQNIQLWEAMVSHLEGMVNMMSAHEGMPMGMMHGGMDHEGMGCCAGMKKGGGCCGGMKDGGGCCGGNKCSQPGPAPEKPAAPGV